MKTILTLIYCCNLAVNAIYDSRTPFGFMSDYKNDYRTLDC